MFKKFPSYFSIIAAIIFILVGLFIALTPNEILVGVVMVIMGSYVLGVIIRFYLETIFPEPEPEEEPESEEPENEDSTSAFEEFEQDNQREFISDDVEGFADDISFDDDSNLTEQNFEQLDDENIEEIKEIKE